MGSRFRGNDTEYAGGNDTENDGGNDTEYADSVLCYSAASLPGSGGSVSSSLR